MFWLEGLFKANTKTSRISGGLNKPFYPEGVDKILKVC
jgi:hypothetical protein